VRREVSGKPVPAAKLVVDAEATDMQIRKMAMIVERARWIFLRVACLNIVASIKDE
jgi:hypothetical protein